jgi:XrtJ-associated TM-motif-TM protein
MFMLKKFAVLCTLLLIACPLVHAQNGCVDSPENPTALLALVGGAGAVAARWFTRWNHRGR